MSQECAEEFAYQEKDCAGGGNLCKGEEECAYESRDLGERSARVEKNVQERKAKAEICVRGEECADKFTYLRENQQV